MSNKEILPQPESATALPGAEVSSVESEFQSAMQVENKQGPTVGPAAISGVAVGQAQAQLGGLAGGQVAQQSFAQQQPVQQQASMPAVADDVDLIEKEWVHKAKAIVAATLGDPYRQSIEINKMKADYIGKRYQREIKIKET